MRHQEFQNGAALFASGNAAITNGLEAGDVVIAPALGTLADSASERIKGIRRLVGHGVSVNVIECGGPVEPQPSY